MSRVHEAFSRAQAADGGTGPAAAAAEHSGVPLEPHESATAWESESTTSNQVDLPISSDLPPSDGPIDGRQEQPHATSDGQDILGEPTIRLSEKLVLSPNTHHSSVEQYRRLAGRLHLAQAEHGIKVVMVASALEGEGKTLTATNLALTLSESYHRNVLLIDGDLRRPSVHEMFQIPNVSGLNDGLRSDVERKVPLVRWSDHLTIVTAGRPDSDPIKVLISQRMRKVIAEAAAKFEWVVIDTPPVGLLTDASLFSAMVDVAVLVVQAGRTPYGEIERAAQAIGKDRVFGVVLNRTDPRAQSNYYAGYRYQYGSKPATQ